MNEELRALISWEMEIDIAESFHLPTHAMLVAHLYVNAECEFGFNQLIPFTELGEASVLRACRVAEAEIAKKVGLFLEGAKTLMEML